MTPPRFTFGSCAALLSALLLAGPAAGQQGRLEAGLAAAEGLVQAAVGAELVPGAVLLVAHRGRVVHEAAYGYAHLYDATGERLPRPRPMTTDHLFDLASLTKVLATTFAVMRLVEAGRVDLDAPVRRYLPAFAGPRKDSVTVRHLLAHTAGLSPWQPTYYHARTPAGVLGYVAGLPLAHAVGARRHYSDLGFMLLGYLVERVAGAPLDAFVAAHVYAPLGLSKTAFTPLAHDLGPFAATSHGNPFERRMVTDDAFGYEVDVDPGAFDGWRRRTLVGEVNDGNACYAHGGVAGHAGLFSTAREVYTLLAVLMDEGRRDGRPYLRPDVVRAFLTPGAEGNGLGWAMAPSVLGVGPLPPGSFGHHGFTGTFALAVPARELAVVLLTNRQNVGLDADGRYPDLGPLQRRVTRILIEAAE